MPIQRFCDNGPLFAFLAAMNVFIGLLLWGFLLVICWPLALILLLLFPFIWLLTLPFKIIGFSLDLVFKLISGILLFPFRILR